MTARSKTTEMLQRAAEVERMEDILLPLQDGNRVSSIPCNAGFSVEHFFRPETFIV